ncbi:MAG: hypothetical protein KC483_10880 [Nitrosarchaeum sp.]|nr:hypothetical protein [Nitrosarchaeum sp.]
MNSEKIKPKNKTVTEYFDDIGEFKTLLERAIVNANRHHEIEFVEGIQARYKKFGEKMFISEKQVLWLGKAAYPVD